MKIVVPALSLILSLAAGPCLAQMLPGAQGQDVIGGGAPRARQRVPDIAPAGVPGAVSAPLATGPSVPKDIGDPTTALFNAINKNDYGAAQDAVSRGANLNAQNPLGETPLDMAVALNRSAIMFMLLGARHEDGDQAAPAPSPSYAAHSAPGHKARARTVIISDHTPAPRPVPMPVMGNDPGTPDPSAGFLGFDPKK
jgi:hypothetical protein